MGTRWFMHLRWPQLLVLPANISCDAEVEVRWFYCTVPYSYTKSGQREKINCDP